VDQTVTVTVHGTNDAPDLLVAAGDGAAKTLTESNAGLVTSGTLTVTDADANDTVALNVASVVASGTTTGLALSNAQLLAMFSVTPLSAAADAGTLNNVNWNFNSGTQAFDYLGENQSLTLTYTLHAADRTSSDEQTVVITINGSNDAPTDIDFNAAAWLAGSTLPGAGATIATLTTDDVDNSSGFTYSFSGGTGAGFSLGANTGVLTTTAALTASSTYTLKFVSTDAAGLQTPEQTLTIITGKNNASDSLPGPSTDTTGDDIIYAMSSAGGSNKDVIFAGSGNDTVFGQDAVDEIHGGLGNDVLHGGAGNDTFFFDSGLNAATNVDRIMDFNATSADSILLSNLIFGLGTGGTLTGGNYAAIDTTSTEAASQSVAASARIVFDAHTGTLYYDANGGSLSDATAFAVLDLAGLTGTFNHQDIKLGA
jgi:VCBS repeat-containing protein